MTTKAPDILTAALGHMQDRAATYDKPEGERSMPATVAAFNAATGRDLTAEEGWLFAIFLKAVRSQQGAYRADNYEDGAAYFALMGEQAAADRVKGPFPSCPPGEHGTLKIDIQMPEGVFYVGPAPADATHRWDQTGHYSKRSGGEGWAIWQNDEWLWIGSEFKGSMEPRNGWVAHDGSDKCPVPKGTWIDVQYTDGDRAYGIRALMENEVLSERGESCGAQYWGSAGANNITHYRLA